MHVRSLGMIAAVAGALAFAGAAAAQGPFVEDFEDSINEGFWRFGGPNERIESAGGNPGRYLRSSGLDSCCVSLTTTMPSSEFHGDYRARGVTGLGLDGILHAVDFSAGERPMTLVLMKVNDPADFEDDLWVWYVSGQIIPQPGQGWVSYSFDVPSDSPTLPPGWTAYQADFDGPPLSPDEIWNRVITDVEAVSFFWHHPEHFYIFQMWDLGADNIWIATGQTCYADCDQDGSLGASDFACFRAAFINGDASADCDGSGDLTPADFSCFRSAFLSGCP